MKGVMNMVETGYVYEDEVSWNRKKLQEWLSTKLRPYVFPPRIFDKQLRKTAFLIFGISKMLKINLFWICPSINILIPFFITGKSIQKLFCYSETSAFAFQKINHD